MNKTGKAIFPESQIKRINAKSLPIWDDEFFVRGDLKCWKISDVIPVFESTKRKYIKNLRGYVRVDVKTNPWDNKVWESNGTPLVLTNNMVIVEYYGTLKFLKRENGNEASSMKIAGKVINNGVAITRSKSMTPF